MYKRQVGGRERGAEQERGGRRDADRPAEQGDGGDGQRHACLLYTSDAADERSSVDLGGRRIIKKKKQRICGH